MFHCSTLQTWPRKILKFLLLISTSFKSQPRVRVGGGGSATWRGGTYQTDGIITQWLDIPNIYEYGYPITNVLNVTVRHSLVELPDTCVRSRGPTRIYVWVAGTVVTTVVGGGNTQRAQRNGKEGGTS